MVKLLQALALLAASIANKELVIYYCLDKVAFTTVISMHLKNKVREDWLVEIFTY